MTLYEQILGDEFEKLSPLVQKMHRYKKQNVLKGSVNIQRGKSLVAKFLNPLMQLPKENKDVLLMLELIQEGKFEKWRRTFGKDIFTSSQYQEEALMVEKMGLVKMYFEVYEEHASLCTVLKKTTCLGITVPERLSVQISSTVKEENGALRFYVQVSTTSGTLIINYHGEID